MEAESALKAFGASLTLFSGYLYLLTCPYERFRAEHLRTDRFALHVLLFALISYVLSVFVSSVIDRKFPTSLLHDVLHKFADSYLHVEVSVFIALGVGPLLGALESLIIWARMHDDPAVAPQGRGLIAKIRSAAVALYIRNCDDDAVRLLHRATIFRKPMTVTLKSGKVYVGQPAKGLNNPSVRAHSIKIIPLASGYRDKDTHKVELPTKYKDIYQKMVLREKEEPASPDDPLAKDLADLACADGTTVETDMQDIGVVILWSEIQSLSLYDENIYRAFQIPDPPATGRQEWFGKGGIIAKVLAVFD